MTTPARMLKRVAISAAIAGLPALWAAPANAGPLSNGLDVNCSVQTGTGVVCIIGGCPRVHGDYVVDAVHFNFNGTGQEEREFKCINGQTARAVDDIVPPPGGSTNIAVQGCRKKTLEGDWCGPWADYKFTVPAGAAPKAPAPKAPDAPAPKPDVQCPPDSPVKTVPAGQTCPAAPPVTNAISLSFGQPQITLIPPSASITATVTNSSALNGKCTYDASPSDTHRDFNVPAHGSTPLTFNGIATRTTYHATVTCTDASGKQTQPIGTASQDVKF